MTSGPSPVVLDASALLGWLRGEPGADVVEPRLAGSAVSAVNWSEVWQKLDRFGVDAERETRRLHHLGVQVHVLTVDDAAVAARLWGATRSVGLSLGDRCCLALAQRLGAVALTADRAWQDLDVGVRIEVVR